LDKRIRNIIEELDTILPERDRYIIIETRASHIITSAINLLRLIKESFPAEEADELSKRLMASIRNEDQMKFKRGIKKLKERRDANKRNKPLDE
jgi:hypothetical protein